MAKPPKKGGLVLDMPLNPCDDAIMEFQGRVHKGVIVPEGSAFLPEGAVVRIVFDVAGSKAVDQHERVALPLVPSSKPGSLRLTGDDIAQALEVDDRAS